VDFILTQMNCCQIKISGKVQGVWFRVEAKKLAEKLGIRGWVRNEPDGTVLIQVEGKKFALDDFIKWCHLGPERAKVEKIEISRCYEATEKGFFIRDF